MTLFTGFDTTLKTQTYTIDSDLIHEEVRIALLTDLHSCDYGTKQIELVSAIHKENPDIILLGGDICDHKIPNDNTELMLKEIAGQYPCYYVTGNHEYRSKDIDTILNLFQSYGVTILSGSYRTIRIRGQKLNICGITDPVVTKYTDSDFDTDKQLNALSSAHENGYYTILLAHRPERIKQYKQYHFDLVLSGHAHGGQWIIPGILNGLYAPHQGVFPKYAGGLYDFGALKMIVSRGLARENTRVPRIFNPPELVMIHLT